MRTLKVTNALNKTWQNDDSLYHNICMSQLACMSHIFTLSISSRMSFPVQNTTNNIPVNEELILHLTVSQQSSEQEWLRIGSRYYKCNIICISCSNQVISSLGWMSILISSTIVAVPLLIEHLSVAKRILWIQACMSGSYTENLFLESMSGLKVIFPI